MKSINTTTINNIANNINAKLAKASAFGWREGKEGFTWVAEKATKAAGFCAQREAKARAKAEAIEARLAQKDDVTASDVFSAVEEAYEEPEVVEEEYEEDPTDFEIIECQWEKLKESHQQFLAGSRSEANCNLLMVQIIGFVNLVPPCVPSLSTEEMAKVTEMVQGAQAMMADLK
jgi:hypothetical protein